MYGKASNDPRNQKRPSWPIPILEVLGDGFQEKSYMSVGDCVNSMLHLIENTNNDVNLFNLGTGDTCSVRRIAEIVVEESKFRNVKIEYTGGKRGWAGDVPKTFLNVDKLLITARESGRGRQRSAIIVLVPSRPVAETVINAARLAV